MPEQKTPGGAGVMSAVRSRTGHSLSGRIIAQLILGLTLSLTSVSSVTAETVASQTGGSQTAASQSPSLVPFGDGIAIADNAVAAQSVAAADLDGDGDTDVISASPGDGTIRWYRNMGGQFPSLPPSTIDFLAGANTVIATDLNRDGAVDIVASGVGGAEGGARFVWYRNNGEANPTFSRTIIGEGLGGPSAIEAADLDSDGDPDLLLALRQADQVVWYENLGGLAPGFAYHLITDQADGAAAVQAGDLDMDGDLDVVMAAENTDTIAWFKNEGGAPLRFSPRVIRTSAQLPSPELIFSRTLDLADINDDGRLDVVYGSKDGGEIGWYENGGGAEPPFQLHVVATEFRNVRFVISTDVNRDGDVDIVAASENRVTVFENSSDPLPQFGQQDLTPDAFGAQALSAADVNGDGLLDLLSASQADHRIVWYPNLAVHRSAFYAPQTRSVVTNGSRARMASSGDLDQDGDIDIVSILGTEILWHQNDGNQPPGFQNRVVDSRLDGGRWVDVADMDGDGDLDIISAITSDNRIAWHENSGGATPSFSTRVISKNAIGVRAALAADLDGDGDQDVYSASHGDNKIAWYENLDGVAGQFAEHVVTQSTVYARSAYAADLDGDGDMDLMSASQNDDKVNWYRNNGGPKPTFTPFTIGYADGVQHIYAADIDSDGDLDILTASEFDNTIAYYENDGAAAPQFVWRPVDQSAAAVHAVLADDFDGDGDMDLVAAIEKLNAFKWYENTGQQPAQFVPHLVYDKALAAHGVHIDDIDGDGDNDLIGASRDDGVIAWFENRGGNYAVGVEQATSAVNAAGWFGELARILVAHRGRSGDADIELNSLEFTFWDGANTQLDDQTFRRLVKSVHVYRDTGDGLFNPSVDQQLVWLDQPGLTVSDTSWCQCRSTSE